MFYTKTYRTQKIENIEIASCTTFTDFNYKKYKPQKQKSHEQTIKHKTKIKNKELKKHVDYLAFKNFVTKNTEQETKTEIKDKTPPKEIETAYCLYFIL